MQETESERHSYPVRVLIAFDQMVNVITGGHPDETISSRAGRAALAGRWWGKVMSAFLNLFESDHGAKAEAGDLERAEQIEYLEENMDSALPKDPKPL
jgi:hypothetical protein